LSRLKTAFEEYYSDNNCYPPSGILKICGEGTDQLAPYLRVVPCDPQTNQGYILVTENDTCPQWFKIYTNLDNKDDDIIADLGCAGGCGPSTGDYVEFLHNPSSEKYLSRGSAAVGHCFFHRRRNNHAVTVYFQRDVLFQ